MQTGDSMLCTLDRRIPCHRCCRCFLLFVSVWDEKLDMSNAIQLLILARLIADSPWDEEINVCFV